MHTRKILLAVLLTTLYASAHAVDGEILITQAKALAGNVAPGDDPGFPVTISQPGKYKLAGSLTVPEGTHGVQITSDMVTLDLNGFTIQGPVTCTGFGGNQQCSASDRAAVTATGKIGVHVRNGTIRGFRWGIYPLGDSGLAEDLLLMDISSTAVLAGSGSIVRGNRMYRVGMGIHSGGLVLNNTTFGAKSSGIASWYGGLVIGNQTHYTGNVGIVGYEQGDAALVHNAASVDGGSYNGIYGGQSLGSNTSNFCEGNLC
ncbi:MAG: hypothetical protein HXY24_04085 [Rubrivivax sp.]|nr:hypothetical protein [Rubrivivax sp.]